MQVYTYTWGNNARRAELKGRACVIEARGRMNTVLVRFLDSGERVTTSRRALARRLERSPEAGEVGRAEDEPVPRRDVHEVEIDSGPRDLAGQVGENARSVLDLDDDHLALAA